MKKHEQHLEPSHLSARLLSGIVMLALGWSVTIAAAHAQSYQRVLPSEPGLSIVRIPVVENIDVEHLTSINLSTMSAEWWKRLIKQHGRMLRSSDEELREQALRNLIFFASNYPEHANLRRVTPRLYKIYRFDKKEEHRILALVALHATGNEMIMERFREHVANEQSERVRKLTLHALADYYEKAGTQ